MHYARRIKKTYMLTHDGNESFQIQESPYKYYVKKFDKKSLNKEMNKIMKKVEQEINSKKEI